jgi:transcriptional regulator with GAF, ATPase, and Fis domain
MGARWGQASLMHPTLVAIDGPLKDAAIPLDAHEVSIGRDPTNGICIVSNSVSRRHCLIRKQSGLLTICDLGSLNGTFVNSIPVRVQVLEHGDVIKIGDVSFRFLVPAREERSGERSVTFEDSELDSRATVSLHIEDSKYLCSQESSATPSERLLQDLRTLVTIATKISSIQQSDSLHWQLLGMILDAIPAERGAILLHDDRTEDFKSVAAWDKVSGPGQAVQVSRTVLQRVVGDSAALLVNDTSADEVLKRASTLMNAQVRSILCAPLISYQKALGAIYLDNRSLSIRFDKGHLELLTSIAGIAALALANVQRAELLKREAQRLQVALDAEHNIVGESAATHQLLGLIARVADTDATVLLCGESGTGKELAARALHRASARRQGPFVAINCAAIPEALLESELFGYDKGAFTGATALKSGQIELAHGGTLFLDEIGELARALQAKLLRFLQEREFTRVGGSRPVRVDVRVIAATNKDLAVAAKTGAFRQDLYYRLNVISVTVPPLRDRPEDIPLLASYFAAKFSAKCKRRVLGISPRAESCLVRYDWPGNIRELENAIERAVVLGSSDLILPEDLPETLFETQPSAEPSDLDYQSAVVELKKQLIIKAVKQARGNYTEAAKKLGVHPNYLHRLIRNMNVKPLLRD